MALTSYNDSRETLRQSYGGVFMFLYGLRRNIHFAILALIPLVAAAPALWWLWLPVMMFLYITDTDQHLRIQDRFGRGRGPYLKKKAGLKYGQFEEWSVISTPKHRGGDGIWPLGNNMFTQEEIWASDDYVRTHAVLSGTTGSGKTVTMSSTFIFVAMVADSGVIMIDGKADPKTWFDLYGMAVAAGRADDFLVLNFVVGASQEAEFAFSSSSEKELWEEFQSIESNTFNIFGTGTADTLFEIGSGLLGDEASGDNKMWVERAQALLRSMLKALVDLRDLGQLKISIATLQEYMSLEKLSELENNPDISEIARQQVGAVLNEIAGYRDAMKVEDPQRRAALLADQPSKQFAFLHMQFGALYAMLIGTYGHIANVEYSDIYTPDVIRARRILLVMLPALEKAPTSLAQLGRMATSAIKSALAQNISGSLTGRKSDLVDRRPTNSIRAMVLIYDEAASYIQAGTADVASQSRSLGAFNIFSSQEWSSFKQAGEIEATRLISNSGLKIVLKNEDKETADHFMNAVGEATVLRSGGKRWEKGKLIETERRLETVPRVTFQEMMNLAEGQAYIKWRDTMILVRMPFVPVKAVVKAQRNDLVPIPGSMPNDRARMRRQKAIAKGVEDTKLPPLNLIEALLECKEQEENAETESIYPLFEMITRTLYKKQVVIPWESNAPPKGKVQVKHIYKFQADTMAEDLMWALQRTDDERLQPLKTLPDTPETRFIIPFLPHEQGLIDPAFMSQASILEIAEETDQAILDADEAIAEKLEQRLANAEANESIETSDAKGSDSDSVTEDDLLSAFTDPDLGDTEISDDDLLGDIGSISADEGNTEEFDEPDLSAFMPTESQAEAIEPEPQPAPGGILDALGALDDDDTQDPLEEDPPEGDLEENLQKQVESVITQTDEGAIDEPGSDVATLLESSPFDDDSLENDTEETGAIENFVPETSPEHQELDTSNSATHAESSEDTQAIRDPLMEAMTKSGISLTGRSDEEIDAAILGSTTDTGTDSNAPGKQSSSAAGFFKSRANPNLKARTTLTPDAATPGADTGAAQPTATLETLRSKASRNAPTRPRIPLVVAKNKTEDDDGDLN